MNYGVNGCKYTCRLDAWLTWGPWHKQMIFSASLSTVKRIAAVWGDWVFSSFRDSFRAWDREMQTNTRLELHS